MLDGFEKQIIATVAYYDGMDYPMTAFEIWKHLVILDAGIKPKTETENSSLENVIEALEGEELKKHACEFRGFYFLKGRNNLVEKRIRKNKVSLLKMKKLRKIVWFLRLVPFIRMVCVTGRLAMKNTDKNSDWDLFVATKKGKIWTGRTLLTVFLQLIGKRRHGDKIKDRVCLNYFVTDESLKIDIEGRPLEINFFSAGEYSFMVPLFGFKKFRKFQIRNAWIREFRPNYGISETSNIKMLGDSHFSKVIRKCGESFLRAEFVENWLRKLEMDKIARNPKTHLPGSIIEANDKALVFLPEPQGKEIYDSTIEKLKSSGIY